MSPERFDHILSLATPLISKKDTKFRKSIPSNERLALTPKFLASRESQISLSFQLGLGRVTVSKIICECCEAIYQVLSEKCLWSPKSLEEWKTVAQQFEDTWNMPHVTGAIDGKHVWIKCSKNTGSLYHNYKGFFSLVLLVIGNANYCFTLFDVGQYGSNKGSGVLTHSNLGGYFEVPSNNILQPESVEECAFDPLPYFLVRDEIFLLKTGLMRSYPGKLAEQKRVFNYHLSWARRVIENFFSILATRWMIFSTRIETSVVNAERYTLACIYLHNYLRQTNNPSSCPNSFVDCEGSTGDIKEEEWRKIVMERNGALANVPHARDSCYKDDAVNMRCCLMTYLNGEGRVVGYSIMLDKHKNIMSFAKKQLCTKYYQKLVKTSSGKISLVLMF